MIEEQFPFLTHLMNKDTEMLCLILNMDDKVLSYYDLDFMGTNEEKAALLALGEVWWYESNRLLPINIFLRDDMLPFKKFIRTVNMKDITIISGPMTSLNNLVRRRIKKNTITLVKRVK